jgi:hypothetical protein
MLVLLTKGEFMKLNYYQDPGHGWIKCNKSLLQKLGIAGDISNYSYMRGDCAYLEEDGDASRLLEAAKAAGLVIQLTPFYSNKNSKIRGYRQYEAPGAEIVQFMRDHFQLINIGVKL